MEGEILSSNRHMLELARGPGFTQKKHQEDGSVMVANLML